ncbi:MAG TPA: hypothetical protein VHR45_21745 [Thermoanaerobaculia bacterium]|nr:hypothetical protein [Thermoanaerobaculia bacterium]
MWAKRVVVTGAGLISPLADSLAGLHRALGELRSARRPIELFPVPGMAAPLGSEISAWWRPSWQGPGRGRHRRSLLRPRLGRGEPRQRAIERAVLLRRHGGAGAGAGGELKAR